MPIVPHDTLVSAAAKERWLRWRADLKNAERKAKKSGQHPSCYLLRADVAPEDELEQSRIRQRHTNNLLQECPSLSPSPEPTEESLCYSTEKTSSSAYEPIAQSGLSSSSWNSNELTTPHTAVHSPVRGKAGPLFNTESSRSAFINSTQKVPTLGQLRAAQIRTAAQIAEDNDMADVPRLYTNNPVAPQAWNDGFIEGLDMATSSTTATAAYYATMSAEIASNAATENRQVEDASIHTSHTSDQLKRPASSYSVAQESVTNALSLEEDRPDHITDTVGAIAIDSWGRIACGASSGGIGMKYRGRVGPAALVGVGAAVIPLDPDDSEQASVATVTSGTGEHMATTMAATTCAERLYQSVKKQKGGEYAEVTEDEALRSMIENEFMGHPSVTYSNSAGAIGILGVKKTRAGIMLFYGHNTDSFALASMSSDDDVPKCTMSRSSGNGQIAQGGRIMSYKTRKRAKVIPRQRLLG